MLKKPAEIKTMCPLILDTSFENEKIAQMCPKFWTCVGHIMDTFWTHLGFGHLLDTLWTHQMCP